MGKIMPQEVVQLYSEVAYHKRRQEKDEQKKRWITSVIDNIEGFNFEPSSNLANATATKRKIRWDNEAREQYRKNRLELIMRYANANPEGFYAEDCLPYVNDNVEHKDLIIARATLTNDLAYLRRCGKIKSHDTSHRSLLIFLPTKENNDETA